MGLDVIEIERGCRTNRNCPKLHSKDEKKNFMEFVKVRGQAYLV